MAEIKNYKAT